MPRGCLGVPSSATTAQKISVLADPEAGPPAGSMSDILLFLPVWGTLEPPGGLFAVLRGQVQAASGGGRPRRNSSKNVYAPLLE